MGIDNKYRDIGKSYSPVLHDAIGSGFSWFLDPLAEIRIRRGDSTYTFL